MSSALIGICDPGTNGLDPAFAGMCDPLIMDTGEREFVPPAAPTVPFMRGAAPNAVPFRRAAPA